MVRFLKGFYLIYRGLLLQYQKTYCLGYLFYLLLLLNYIYKKILYLYINLFKYWLVVKEKFFTWFEEQEE